MREIILEVCMAIAFYTSLAISSYIAGDFIEAGLILSMGTIVTIIIYNIANKSEHPLMKILDELF